MSEADIKQMGYLVTGWTIGLLSYLSISFGTFCPVLWILVKGVKLNGGGPSFDESPRFPEEAKLLLKQHQERIHGTLSFWKNRAEKYRAFHLYCLCWIIVATVTVPFLTQAISTDPWSKWLVSIISAHALLLLSLHRGLKIEQNFKNYRHGESEYYDLTRNLLDNPTDFGDNWNEQITSYFGQVKTLRKLVRLTETDNFASIEEISDVTSRLQTSNNKSLTFLNESEQ